MDSDRLRGLLQAEADGDGWKTGGSSAEGLAGFEERLGLNLPQDFRVAQLEFPRIYIRTRLYGDGHRVYGGELESFGTRGSSLSNAEKTHAQFADALAQGRFDILIDEWIAGMVPIYFPYDGHTMVCFDTAFDAINPPVLHVDYGSSWSVSDRDIQYVADSFTSLLQLDLDAEELERNPTSRLSSKPHCGAGTPSGLHGALTV